MLREHWAAADTAQRIHAPQTLRVSDGPLGHLCTAPPQSSLSQPTWQVLQLPASRVTRAGQGGHSNLPEKCCRSARRAPGPVIVTGTWQDLTQCCLLPTRGKHEPHPVPEISKAQQPGLSSGDTFAYFPSHVCSPHSPQPT